MKPHLVLCLAVAMLAACGPKKVVVDPAIAARATLALADRNLRAGCFDCLVEALQEYESIRGIAVVADAATAGVLRAAGLLALRERELGTTDSAYLERARELVATTPALRAQADTLLELVTIMPWRAAAGRSGLPDSTSISIYANRTQRLAGLKQAAGQDEVAAYMFVAYACESGAGLQMGNGEMKAAVGAMADTLLVAYRLSICPTSGLAALDEVLAKEPRYKEAAFYKGLNATSARKLDDADARYREAYGWRKTWPAATLAIANVSMSAEEFEISRQFYDETLTLAPLFPDALLGKVRALTYLAKYEDSMGVADQLLALGRYPGDARYWKAYDELQLERYDAAWADIEAADRLLINSDVPKLAGIIAINRQQLDVARQKLELSKQRNPNDCQTLYYLHLVLAEQRHWPETVLATISAEGCLDAAMIGLRNEIDTIRASDVPEARKMRQIAGREQQIATAIRMRATCWFNGGVANLNLSKKAEAKELLEKLADDQQFGERARQLLALTRP